MPSPSGEGPIRAEEGAGADKGGGRDGEPSPTRRRSGGDGGEESIERKRSGG